MTSQLVYDHIFLLFYDQERVRSTGQKLCLFFAHNWSTTTIACASSLMVYSLFFGMFLKSLFKAPIPSFMRIRKHF